MKNKYLKIALTVVFTSIIATTKAQGLTLTLTMEQTIALAQGKSVDAMAARNTFLGNYWSFRSYQASRLPSLNFTGNIADFNRSFRPLQDYQTGEISYKENYNMYNTGAISLDQNVAATGGRLSLYSSLSRLDQWAPVRDITYYSQPITLTYLQPLWTYNSFKWDKKLEPERYEQSKREYLESMEGITVKAVRLFCSMLLSKANYDIACTNYTNTKAMYGIAGQRLELGSVKKPELLQLELRMINDSLAINNQENLSHSSRMALKSLLGFGENDDIELIFPDVVPDITLDHTIVLNNALRNSSFEILQRITSIEAEQEVARAKGNRGISAQLSTQFGLSNSSDDFKRAYSNLLEQEILGLTLRIPIMDWGMGKGRVKVAQSRLETTRNRIEQALIDYRQEIYTQVMQFNAQQSQCALAQRAKDIADERYRMTMSNFANGTVSVTDLNTAQTEKDEASRKYITELSNFWIYYYSLRKLSLYDYISAKDISAEYDKLVK